jgi:hypothetical protein
MRHSLWSGLSSRADASERAPDKESFVELPVHAAMTSLIDGVLHSYPGGYLRGSLTVMGADQAETTSKTSRTRMRTRRRSPGLPRSG